MNFQTQPKVMARYYGPVDVNWKRILLWAGSVSLLFYFLYWNWGRPSSFYFSEPALKAARIMSRAIDSLKVNSCRVPDPVNDPNRTGLIGLEWSELTTTLGDVAAKRTTTNPNLAALLVYLLQQAGVNRGDTIAVGCSGSFPGLLVAIAAAAAALEVEPLVILSLGSSSFGANDPHCHLFDLYEQLRRAGFVRRPPVAVTLGGERDMGLDWPSELRHRLRTELLSNGIEFFAEPDLQRNVARRLKLYFGRNGARRIAAFVNIGGAWANLGESALVLQLSPGVVRRAELPPVAKSGVLFAMLRRGVPVIHLLYIKGLVRRYGLPWDPVPLPEPGEGVTPRPSGRSVTIAVAYFGVLALIVALFVQRKQK